MNFRSHILLYATGIILLISSCDKNQSHSPIAIKRNVIEKEDADSAITGIKQKIKTITINPLKTNTLISKNGIKFLIPPNAFVTLRNTKPKANIQITISEYHNPADILVSKIPMQYKTKAGPVQMESAGMFAITAHAGEEMLQLASGKEIDVQVPSKNTDIDFNLYYFDPISNEWIQTVDSLLISESETGFATSNQFSSQESIATESSTSINVEWSAVEANKRIVSGKIINLVKPDCSYKNTNFDFTVATDDFPELTLYKETVWVGSTASEESLVASAFENDALISARIKEREIPLNRYLVSFEFRHTKFSAYMKIASTSEFCDINEEIFTSYYNNRPVDESKIKKIHSKIKIGKKQKELFRSFVINKLGIWNCDRLYVLPEKMLVTPRFRSVITGEYYESATTYMIDKKINSVWTFDNTITLNPDSDNIILFVNEKGKICYARLNKLSKTHKAKELNLIIDVEELADKPGSTEDLDKLLQQI